MDVGVKRRAKERTKRRHVQTDMERILGLPCRTLDLQNNADADYWTRELRRHDAAPPLRAVQGVALAELFASVRSGVPGKGLLGPIGVGWGKTGIAELAGTVASRAEGRKLQAVLLVPAELRQKTLRDRSWWRSHYTYTPPTLITHHKLSSPDASDLLDRLAPDIIIIDEAHAFRHGTSSRTKRLLRYAVANPKTRFVLLSGSMTARGLEDYHHLAELALRDHTPIPLSTHVREVWSAVIDVQGEPNADAYRTLDPLVTWAKQVPDVRLEGADAAKIPYRKAFAHRLTTTPGVVATSDASATCSLVIETLAPPLPTDVETALGALTDHWETPDGEGIVDILSYTRAAMQLSAGYYTRWVWPDDEPDHEWLELRRAWASTLRTYLEHHAARGLDSPALVIRAIQEGKLRGLASVWEAWQAVEDRYGRTGPPSEVVWIDRDMLVQHVVDWKNTRQSGIIWYSSIPVGDALKSAGFRVYGAGSTQPKPPSRSWQSRFPACSIKVHGTGKNLQAWSEQLVLQPPASGQAWEQLLGRTHRPGQAADEVRCTVLHHTWYNRARLLGAKRDARYIEHSQQMRQKLNLATWA